MKELVWCFMYVKATALTENYKAGYEVWGETPRFEDISRGKIIVTVS
jgi:hypothetical protein